MLGWLKGNGRWLALSALVLLNVVLITLLLVQQTTTLAVPAEVPPSTSPSGPSGPSVSPRESASPRDPASPSGSTGPGVSPSPTQSDSPSPSTSGSSTDAPRRLIAANSAKIAWRAEEGDCDHPSTVEVTSDGGRTWRKTKPGIRGIVRLRAYSQSSVFAVGADTECKPTYAWITSPDRSWRSDQSVMWDVWFRYPDDLDRVHAPGGRTSRPCGSDLVSFAATEGSAAVLCGDGRVRTIQTSERWRTVTRESPAAVLGNSDREILVALPSASCGDIVIRRLRISGSSGIGGEAGVCNGRTGPLAVAASGQAVWSWIGPDVLVS